MTTASNDNRTRAVPLRALLFTDKPVLAKAIALCLNHARFTSRATANLTEAMAWVAEWEPGVIIFDLESGDLVRFVRRVRAVSVAPVLGVTQETRVDIRFEAFDKGVDDILTLPFYPEEILTRVVAVTRRAYRQRLEMDVLQTIGVLKVDIVKRTVWSGEREIPLSALEMSLLYLLAGSGQQALTRGEIVDNLWGTNYLADSNVVDRHIRKLRVKLRDTYRRPRFILTQRGIGYSFIRPPVKKAPAKPAPPKGAS